MDWGQIMLNGQEKHPALVQSTQAGTGTRAGEDFVGWI